LAQAVVLVQPVAAVALVEKVRLALFTLSLAVAAGQAVATT
jgi:hypothetical protein